MTAMDAVGNRAMTMNAIHAPHDFAPRAPAHAAAPHSKRRRWAIGLSIGGAFLGLYVLGLVWFAHALQDDMQATLQRAPAVQDTAHRAE
jgi:type VI protein secretion system component VasF